MILNVPRSDKKNTPLRSKRKLMILSVEFKNIILLMNWEVGRYQHFTERKDYGESYSILLTKAFRK